jgi:hypothetical protein
MGGTVGTGSVTGGIGVGSTGGISGGGLGALFTGSDS